MPIPAAALLATLLAASAGRGAQELRQADFAELWSAVHEELAEGDPARAERLALRALERSPANPACAHALACARLAQGDRDGALEWLESAVEYGFVDAPLARWDPDLAPLRGDPRFERCLAGCDPGFGRRAEGGAPLVHLWPASPGATAQPALSPDGSRALTREGILWDLESGAVQLLFDDPARPATFAAFSPLGSYAATADRARRVRLFDPRDGRLRLEIEGKAHASLPLEISADEGRLACATPRGVTRVVGLPDGEPLAELATRGDAAVHLSPRGERALTLGAARAVLWDVDTGLELWTLEPERRGSFRGDFDVQGELAFVLVRGTGELFALDARTGRELARIEGDGTRRTAVCALPRENALAVGDAAGVVTLLDPLRGLPLGSFQAHTGAVGALTASRDGALLATTGEDLRMTLWDPGLREPLWELGRVAAGRYQRPSFDAAGLRVALGASDEQLELRDALDGAQLARLRYPVLRSLAVAFTPDARRVAVLASDGSLRLVDVASGATERVLGGLGPRVADLAISPDGTRLAISSWEGHACLVALPEADLLARLEAYEGSQGAPRLAFSPDSSRLLTYGRGQRAGVFAARDGAQERWIADPDFGIERVVWSLDGARLASLDAGHRVRVLDVRSGDQVGPPLDHRQRVRCLVFHDFGRALLTAGDAGVARLFDVESGALRAVFEHAGAGRGPWIDGAAFDPTGRWLATTTGDLGRLTLWEVEGAREHWRAEYGGGAPLSLHVQFDAAGERLFVAGRHDRGARIVRVEDAALLARLGAGIGALALSADERHVVGLGGSALHLFDAETGAERLGRVELTDDEHLLLAPSGHYDGSLRAARRAQALVAGDALPLDGLAAALYDPKKVRAAAAGVPVAPAPALAPPRLDLHGRPGLAFVRDDEGRLRIAGRADGPRGVLAVEAWADGDLLARAEPEVEPGQRPRGYAFVLEFRPPAQLARLELRAVGGDGLTSRPARVDLR